MNEPDQPQPPRCAQCHRDLQLGEDVLAVERGVVGPRGIVPLEDVQFFCDDACLNRYHSGPDPGTHRLPRRIP